MPHSQTYPNRPVRTDEPDLPNGVAALAVALVVIPIVVLLILAIPLI